MFDLCTIGNALVDILVSSSDRFLEEQSVVKGAMTLVDEERACQLYENAGPAVELSSGGSAANTASGAASFGATCAYLGKVGTDSFGEVFKHDLVAQNIFYKTTASKTAATGRCLIFVTPDAQRSMNTYLGAAVEFGPNDIDVETVQASAITYLEGYLFDKPLAQEAFKKASRVAHEASRKVSLTLSDVFCVKRHREAFLSLIHNDIDILFANENEIKELCQCQDLDEALKIANGHAETVVVTRGASGAIVKTDKTLHKIRAVPVDPVIDTTGAGDLFAAGYLYGLSCRATPEECGYLGAVAASEVIGHFGPRPQRCLKELI